MESCSYHSRMMMELMKVKPFKRDFGKMDPKRSIQKTKDKKKMCRDG